MEIEPFLTVSTETVSLITQTINIGCTPLDFAEAVAILQGNALGHVMFWRYDELVTIYIKTSHVSKYVTGHISLWLDAIANKPLGSDATKVINDDDHEDDDDGDDEED